MRLVIIESPYAGDVERNLAYAKLCVLDCLRRGESPYASHLFFTQEGILDDLKPEERTLGIEAGLAWGEKADATVVYTDLGFSSGMRLGIERAEKAGRPVEHRNLLAGLLSDYDRLNYILGPREGCGEMIDGLREELGLPEGTKRPQIVVRLIIRINEIKDAIKNLGGIPEDWEPTYGRSDV